MKVDALPLSMWRNPSLTGTDGFDTKETLTLWPQNLERDAVMLYGFELAASFHEGINRYAMQLPRKGTWQHALKLIKEAVLTEKRAQLDYWANEVNVKRVQPWPRIETELDLPMIVWLKPACAVKRSNGAKHAIDPPRGCSAHMHFPTNPPIMHYPMPHFYAAPCPSYPCYWAPAGHEAYFRTGHTPY